jgi:uncharacterized membrane protein YbhN (UPF0104 family)
MTGSAASTIESPRRQRLAARRVMMFAIKVLISGGLVWLIVANIDLAEAGSRLLRPHAWPIAAALAVLWLQVWLISWRFDLILAAIYSRVGVARLFVINMIGLFFNQSLPSTIGGDAVRMWRLIRAGLPFGVAVNAVLLDRGTALLAILIMIAVLFAPLAAAVNDPHPVYALGVVVFGALGAAALVIALGRLPAPLLRWRVFRGINTLIGDLRRLVRHPRSAAPVFGLALVNHVLTSTVVYLMAVAYDVPIGFIACLLVVPPVLLVAVVPISIAGWGLREGAMIAGFALFGLGSAEALVVSVAFGLINVAVGLPGGPVFLLTNDARKHG